MNENRKSASLPARTAPIPRYAVDVRGTVTRGTKSVLMVRVNDRWIADVIVGADDVIVCKTVGANGATYTASETLSNGAIAPTIDSIGWMVTAYLFG